MKAQSTQMSTLGKQRMGKQSKQSKAIGNKSARGAKDREGKMLCHCQRQHSLRANATAGVDF